MTCSLSKFKNTVLLFLFALTSCANQSKCKQQSGSNYNEDTTPINAEELAVGAAQTAAYFPLLKGKSIAVVANQTSVIFKENGYTHLIDSLLSHSITIKKVFAPEHGFRGKVDAGKKVQDGIDAKTGLPIISLYGANKKPTKKQLQDIDVVLFDIQDVGVRFYTYIATLQLVMEACAENDIPLIILDRPNPNAHYVDGPTMEKQHTSFLGMTTIPLVYGMTIGEYAQMINEEGWLNTKEKATVTIVPVKNWKRTSSYHLPIRPSPNLPNDVAINLYPSLGLFEGTNINAGRGTEFQFQRYGASFLDSIQYNFSYTPISNFGAKYPKEQNKKCYGVDLSIAPKMSSISLRWLLDAYKNAVKPDVFFLTEGFTKHAGTAILQKQIEAGFTENEIRATWQKDIGHFLKIREKYLFTSYNP